MYNMYNLLKAKAMNCETIAAVAAVNVVTTTAVDF